MSMIRGIHHINLDCVSAEEFEKVRDLYIRVLGLPEVRTWDGGCMIDAGNCIIEVFRRTDTRLGTGAIRHFAFEVEDPDALIEIVRKEGYAVTIEPKMVEIQSDPILPIRVAFFEGPVGESIEFFHIREV